MRLRVAAKYISKDIQLRQLIVLLIIATKTVSPTWNTCSVNRLMTVFYFMVQGMTVGITGNVCWWNRGPTGKQVNTGKNCFTNSRFVLQCTLSWKSPLKLNSISGKHSSVNSSLRTNESTLDYSVNSWIWVHPYELNINSSAGIQLSLFAQTIFSFWITFFCTEWGEMRECWMNPWVHIEFIQLTLSS